MKKLKLFFSQVAIKAGHEFILSTDDKYAKSCDSQIMWMDYVSHYLGGPEGTVIHA
jgi:hypothetical protein